MEWIEVSEDLPEFGMKVLVCDKFNSFVSMGRLIEVQDEENPIFEMMNIEKVEGDSVITHWMSLPLSVGEYGYT